MASADNLPTDQDIELYAVFLGLSVSALSGVMARRVDMGLGHIGNSLAQADFMARKMVDMVKLYKEGK